jgi:hypothetical protein
METSRTSRERTYQDPVLRGFGDECFDLVGISFIQLQSATITTALSYSRFSALVLEKLTSSNP